MRLSVYLPCALLGLTLTGVRAAEGTNPPVATQPLPLPAEAAKLTDGYRTEIARITGQYNEDIKALPTAYQAQIQVKQKKSQASGDLDGYLSFTKELTRFAAAIKGEADPFEKIPEMPESALVTAPEALRVLQDQYLKVYKEKAERRHKQIEDSTNVYIARLESLQKELTILDRIQAAIDIKREIDRLHKEITDDTVVQQALALVASQPAPATPAATHVETPASASSTFGHMPDWARWEYEKEGNFAWEGYLFLHPDLPDELTLDFDHRIGRAHVYGRCQVDRQIVDQRERAWFGKAIAWKVKDPATLNATIVLQSREIAAGQGNGPAAHLVLLNDKGPIGEGLDVTLMWHEVTLTLARDPASGKCVLSWTEGKVKKLIDLPASGAVHVLLGVTVRNPGERCDTSIEMR